MLMLFSAIDFVNNANAPKTQLIGDCVELRSLFSGQGEGGCLVVGLRHSSKPNRKLKSQKSNFFYQYLFSFIRVRLFGGF